MLAAMLISLPVVFLAELGDKSQLITMSYALRHRWWVVLGGVGIAAFAVHGISVTVGHFLGLTLPARPIAAVAGVAFICFAAWTWRESSTAGGGDAPVREPRFVLFAVVSSVLLAELGDKTMLATVALASDHNWLGVWLGATAAMVLADAVAIAVGGLLHRRLPEHLLHGAAALLFLAFGLWMLLDEALGQRPAAIASIAALLLLAFGATLRGASRGLRNDVAGRPREMIRRRGSKSPQRLGGRWKLHFAGAPSDVEDVRLIAGADGRTPTATELCLVRGRNGGA